jgi:WD40 repeat protein
MPPSKNRLIRQADSPPQIFLSYSHHESDTMFARQVRDHLRSIGYRVWFDEDMGLGEYWPDRIDKGLRSSDAVVGIISPSSIASKNVQNEWVFAQEHDITLKLLLFEPTEIPAQFIRINYLDCTKKEKEGALEKLKNDLERQFGDRKSTGSDPTITNKEHLHSKELLDENGHPSPDLIHLQSFQTSSHPEGLHFSNENKQLWSFDGEQIEAFSPNSPYRKKRWFIQNKRWKYVANQIWQGSLICSDWDGSLYIYMDPERNESNLIYQASYDDLPIHLISVSNSGILYTASWDGTIRVWDNNKKPLFPFDKIHLTHLPKTIIPYRFGHFAVIDELETVWLFDESGELIWKWQCKGSIQDMWVSEWDLSKSHPLTFLVLLENKTIIQIKLYSNSDSSQEVLQLPGAVKHFSHLKKGGWTALALENETLAWLSWSSFRIPKAYRIKLDWAIKDIIALHDPQRPSVLVSIGRTVSNHLFATNDHQAKKYDLEPVSLVYPDPSQRFLFVILNEAIEMYRNPAFLPLAYEVTIDSIEGTLLVGEYSELIINLVNCGSIPISTVSAALRGRDRILPSSEIIQEGKYLPGEKIPLRFSVQSIASGSLQVNLQLSMEDEYGPPSIYTELSVHIESQK